MAPRAGHGSAYRQAQADAARARRTVAAQRDRIGALVAQSYQHGGDLTALNAMMSADGPEGVLDQYAAFQGASTSLQADYKRFAATDSLAQVFESKARHAKAEQVAARRAGRAGQAAGGRQRADAAQAEAPGIAAEKDRLIPSSPRRSTSRSSLARKRQTALEEIARKRAEERARRAAARRAPQAAQPRPRGSRPPTRPAAKKKAAEQAAAAAAGRRRGGREAEGRRSRPRRPGPDADAGHRSRTPARRRRRRRRPTPPAAATTRRPRPPAPRPRRRRAAAPTAAIALRQGPARASPTAGAPPARARGTAPG